MSFETTVRAFAAALGEPSASPPAMTQGRLGAPDARRFAVYRNNVAVGLIGALEARFPVSRRLAGDDLFRAMARAFVRAYKPRSPIMIAYGEEFPEFAAEYLQRSLRRVSSPLVGEDQGGGSHSPSRQGSGGASHNLLGQRDPPPLPAPTRGGGCANAIESAEIQYPPGSSRRVSSPLVGEDQGAGSRSPPRLRSSGWSNNLLGQRDPPPLPAPTRGGGCANVVDPVRHAIAALPDVARLENAWVEAYHAEDASVATVGDLAALDADSLPTIRIAFHPAARLLRFATLAATVWASAQNPDHSAALPEGRGEDALITRPNCDVRVRVLPPHGFDFALKMQEGATLIEALTALDDPDFDFGTHLVGLVESGAIASIIPGRAS